MKDEKVKITVNTFNWGPCVIKLKIQDDFKKVLLEEAKKTEEDFRHRLAGQIEKERGYSEEQRNKLYHFYHRILVFITNAFKDIRIKNLNMVHQNTY